MIHHQTGSVLENAVTVTAPLARTIEATVAHYGWTRTFIYLKLATGELDAIKAGRRTTIITDSAEQLFSSLPKATFRCPRKAA